MRLFKQKMREAAQRERDRPPAPTTIVVPQIVPNRVLDRIDNLRSQRASRSQSSNETNTSDPSAGYDNPETTPETLRHLRDLIRTRYQLDTHIWALKDVRAPDRPIVLEKMEKADAVLREIYDIVRGWEEQESARNPTKWSAKEWRMAQAIKYKIEMDGKRWWTNNPPWNDAHSSRSYE